MKAFIGVTDHDWFLFLRSQPSIEEVNFWQTLFLLSGFNFSHNFYEIVNLPENDRTRISIHPEAQREVLKRILDLNHKIHV